MALSKQGDHQIDHDDRQFLQAVRQGEYPVAQFGHREHLRLAYILLCESGSIDAAAAQMRGLLLGLLNSAGIDPDDKYHETITQAWIRLTASAMQHAPACASSSAFINGAGQWLGSASLLRFYSHSRLYSEAARKAHLQPDLAPLPSASHYMDSAANETGKE